MDPEKRKPVACMYVLLLVSMHPINAARVQDLMDGDSADYADLYVEHDDGLHQSLSVQMQDALANNISSHAAWFGKLEGTCAGLKAGLERRAEKVRRRAESMDTDNPSFGDMSYVALKTHKVTKTLQKAQKMECEWVKEGNFDRTALDAVGSRAVRQKCKEKATAILEAASTGSSEEQTAAMKDAVAVLLAQNDDCTSEETGDEVGETDEVSIDNEAQELQTLSGTSLMQLNSTEVLSSGVIIFFAWPFLAILALIAAFAVFVLVVAMWGVISFAIECLIWDGLSKLVQLIKGGKWKDIKKKCGCYERWWCHKTGRRFTGST